MTSIPDRIKFDRNKNSWVKQILFQLGLVALSSLLFSASFPNPILKNGFPFLAWFAFIPVLSLVKKNNLLACAGWGAIYGCLSYALFNYWLGTFHPMAGIFVYCLYSFYIAIVFLLFKLAEKLYPKRAYIVQWTIWIAYEYLRTKGFLGYSYGIIGYSQWQFIPLIQIASITGVWGVSALVAFPSFYLINLFDHEPHEPSLRNQITSSCCSWLKEKKEMLPAIIWLVAFIIALIYGVAKDKDFSSQPQVNIALIQHNTDPWAAARAPAMWQKHNLYRRDLASLIRLSDQALASNPKPQLVVWPETAFIPRIHWHSTQREDQDSWLIVKELLDYLAKQDVPFLIGNDDGRIDPSKNPNANEKHRIDYNAAMLFKDGQNTHIYRKLHLVPFTEHFPYKKQFPLIYNALINADTYFWEKGTEKTVFKVDGNNGFSFSSPICFEDSFGYLSRDFVREGAEVLVNLTNDAWANSLSAQKQHMSMAVFRAVENSRSMVRATVSGQTCAIDPTGRLIAEAPAFQEAYLAVHVPISKKTTLYTLYGDYLAYIFIFAALALLISKAVWCTIKQ